MAMVVHGVSNNAPQTIHVKNENNKKVSFEGNVFDNFDKDVLIKKTSKPEKQESIEIAPPKIKFSQILFGRLKKEQVEAINATGMLPKNAKFQGNTITFNFINFTEGTQILPLGYEVKNDRFGFTHVVRQGTKSWMFKN